MTCFLPPLPVVQAEALAVSVRQQQVMPYAQAVARAIPSGGESGQIAYAAAFAQAVAGSGCCVEVDQTVLAN